MADFYCACEAPRPVYELYCELSFSNLFIASCGSQNEEFTIYSDYAENYMDAVMMVDKLVNKPGAPDYLGVSVCVCACVCVCVFVCE